MQKETKNLTILIKLTIILLTIGILINSDIFIMDSIAIDSAIDPNDLILRDSDINTPIRNKENTVKGIIQIVGTLISLLIIIYVIYSVIYDKIKHKNKDKWKNLLLAIAITCLSVIAISVLWINFVLNAFIVLYIAFVILLAMPYSKEEKRRRLRIMLILAIILVTVANCLGIESSL